MEERFQKSVLDDLVHLGRVTQVVICDSGRSALLEIDNLAEPFGGPGTLVIGQEPLDLGCESGLDGNGSNFVARRRGGCRRHQKRARVIVLRSIWPYASIVQVDDALPLSVDPGRGQRVRDSTDTR